MRHYSANTYRKIKEVIHERGWIKGGRQDEEGHVCLVGAAVHLGLSGHRFEHDPLLLSIIHEQFPDRRSDWIPGFNDWSSTTLDDINMILDKAAVRAEEGFIDTEVSL